ncbi:MAG TPA: FAD/NAD(P)-binding oxidoreductase [Acidimicrobiales bacterium]|nr:FAD/NAD(P)-binding oxidoreductase [Acidimicrobiales bacterium]
MRILVLGAGFGGLELSTRLSDALGEDVETVLIDKSDGFIFGFSKLDVMFGRSLPETVIHPYRDLVKPGVRFVQATVRTIDPVARRVETDEGAFDAEIMVVALGADVDPSATSGLIEAGHEFYTVSGAFGLREVLSRFDGGRVIVGVTSTPFKCPPAPSEATLLIHDYLTERGVRQDSSISLVMPLGVPVPPSPAASEALLLAFAEREIGWFPERLVESLDPSTKTALLSDGSAMPFDLFLGVPVHKVPAAVADSGLTVDGWIPVDPLTLETSFPGVYAVGDVTSVGTPKAGVFSERQASVVAEQIIQQVRGGSGAPIYDGRGVCYLEFGGDLVARVDVTFLSGKAPVGALEGPSRAIAADKGEFGSSRIQRWFDRTWTDGRPSDI